MAEEMDSEHQGASKQGLVQASCWVWGSVFKEEGGSRLEVSLEAR